MRALASPGRVLQEKPLDQFRELPGLLEMRHMPGTSNQRRGSAGHRVTTQIQFVGINTVADGVPGFVRLHP